MKIIKITYGKSPVFDAYFVNNLQIAQLLLSYVLLLIFWGGVGEGLEFIIFTFKSFYSSKYIFFFHVISIICNAEFSYFVYFPTVK